MPEMSDVHCLETDSIVVMSATTWKSVRRRNGKYIIPIASHSTLSKLGLLTDEGVLPDELGFFGSGLAIPVIVPKD